MVDPVSRLNSLFGERYRFERVIGRGRVGTVFQAQDRKFGRIVAVKVLWAREVGTRASEQFLREVEIAARLSHPNILPVFDSGEREDVAFFVMPLAAGGSLGGRLEREGPLPIPDAIRIASEVLDALECAHAHGVVHLDVKPENILLQEDHALLADFGVARVVSQGDRGWRSGAAEVVGSVLYMCPDHAARRRTQDPRSDLYSLGCVLYHMLSGEPPFKGPSAAAILRKHHTEPPFPLTQRAAVSRELDHLVRKALEKEAADRFQAAGAFLRALRSVADSPSLPAGRADIEAVGQEGPSGERRHIAGRRNRPEGSDPGREGVPDRSHPVTVWIVEDSADTRFDIQRLVRSAEGMVCPLAFESGEDCLAALKDHWAPDVVIMDIGLPGLSGIETTRRLKRSWPGTEVVMFTVHEDFDRIFQAFQAGAVSYLDKTAPDGEILRAVREAGRRGSVLTPPIARRFLSLFKQFQSAAAAYQLSPEDVELLSGLVGGKAMEEIALHLGLSAEALESRLSLVHAKLHANRDLPLR